MLVSNAGLSHLQSLEDITAAQFDQMLAVNLRAPFLLVLVRGGLHTGTGFGGILFISGSPRSPAASPTRISRRPRPGRTG